MPGPQRRGTGATAGGPPERTDRRGGGGRDGRDRRDSPAEKSQFIERVVTINRVAKVV